MRLSAPVFRLKRQAKVLSRDAGIPLHKALDRVARREGFRSWSRLAAHLSAERPARTILTQLEPGDLVLLGARPGHGKTLLGLELLVEAVKSGRHGCFFTLEYNEDDALRHLRSIGGEPSHSLTIDTSDDICANYVMERLRGAPRGAIAAIDYLQILDQKRQNPSLFVQMDILKTFAVDAGLIVVLISQIDRSFDGAAKTLPDLSDVRLPNPVDLSLFSKTCFLHDGTVGFEMVPESAV